MTDLISRADAIKAVASITMSIHLSDVICDKLLALPSADVIPIVDLTDGKTKLKAEDWVYDATPSADAVHGEWIKTTSGNGWNEWYVLKCPFCDATIEDKQNRKWEYNYCPSCGARMYKGGAE